MDKMLPLFVCGIAYSFPRDAINQARGRLLRGFVAVRPGPVSARAQRLLGTWVKTRVYVTGRECAEVRCRPNSPCPTLLKVSTLSELTRGTNPQIKPADQTFRPSGSGVLCPSPSFFCSPSFFPSLFAARLAAYSPNPSAASAMPHHWSI